MTAAAHLACPRDTGHETAVSAGVGRRRTGQDLVSRCSTNQSRAAEELSWNPVPV